MSNNDYQYIIELYHVNGHPIGQAVVAPDWEPAREWIRFTGMRRAQLPLTVSSKEALIEPVWHPKANEPYVSGVRISFENGCGPVAEELSTAYFRDFAQAAASQFVEKGVLQTGDNFSYLVAAYARADEPAATNALSIKVEETEPALGLREGELGDFLRVSSGYGLAVADQMPVFIPQQVLDEIRELTQQAGERETGGILIGHLRRDQSIPEIFVEVTTQLAARHTVSELTKLTFTSETWTECRAALALRRKDEIFLGWWHSHPVRAWQCRSCPVERQQVCHLARDFFSEHDRRLQRTVFPRAYSIALVANDVAFSEISYSLFGWRKGRIEPRGFQILNRRSTEYRVLSDECGTALQSLI
jgi:proteasome lid subunit RPN8/RPN11